MYTWGRLSIIVSPSASWESIHMVLLLVYFDAWPFSHMHMVWSLSIHWTQQCHYFLCLGAINHLWMLHLQEILLIPISLENHMNQNHLSDGSPFILYTTRQCWLCLWSKLVHIFEFFFCDIPCSYFRLTSYKKDLGSGTVHKSGCFTACSIYVTAMALEADSWTHDFTEVSFVLRALLYHWHCFRIWRHKFVNSLVDV